MSNDVAASGALAPASETLPDPDAEAGGVNYRVVMARTLADIIVLPTGRISANERALAADMMLQISAQISLEDRASVAESVAAVAECPPALLRAFLMDEPEAAGPVLEKSEHIPEALLIDCARTMTTAHRMLIAKRSDLTTSIADVLIGAEEDDVALQVLRREDVVLSPNAIETLVVRSATDDDLQALLLRRSELEPAHGFVMFWWVRGDRRRRVLARFSLDRYIIQDAFKDLYRKVFTQKNPDPFVEEILIMNDRRHRPR
ncbi:MAG: DUF2336 domain-containing protein, partial [Pseudomonadota bacterium]